jgi:hypothetical protein
MTTLQKSFNLGEQTLMRCNGHSLQHIVSASVPSYLPLGYSYKPELPITVNVIATALVSGV